MLALAPGKKRKLRLPHYPCSFCGRIFTECQLPAKWSRSPSRQRPAASRRQRSLLVRVFTHRNHSEPTGRATYPVEEQHAEVLLRFSALPNR